MGHPRCPVRVITIITRLHRNTGTPDRWVRWTKGRLSESEEATLVLGISLQAEAFLNCDKSRTFRIDGSLKLDFLLKRVDSADRLTRLTTRDCQNKLMPKVFAVSESITLARELRSVIQEWSVARLREARRTAPKPGHSPRHSPEYGRPRRCSDCESPIRRQVKPPRHSRRIGSSRGHCL